MVTGVAYVGTVVAAVGSATIGGLLFAFSTAVLPALAGRPDGEGMAAMQAINRLILNPLFLLVFSGTALVCAALAVVAAFADQPGTLERIIGALLYVIGAFGVTAVVHVPLNNRLDASADDEVGRAYWRQEYLSRWVLWNHVRAVAAVAGAVLLIVSLG